MIKQCNIIDFIPHRAPFLFIDAVEDFEPDRKIIIIKRVTADEQMLVTENDGNKRFPETLIIEAAAQAVLLFSKLNQVKKNMEEGLFVLGKIKGEFFKQVFVGDDLKIKVEQVRLVAQGGYADVEVVVLAELVAKVEVFFSLVKGDGK